MEFGRVILARIRDDLRRLTGLRFVKRPLLRVRRTGFFLENERRRRDFFMILEAERFVRDFDFFFGPGLTRYIPKGIGIAEVVHWLG